MDLTAGVYPSIGKLEGYDTTGGARCSAGAGRDWLQIAAAPPGYAGFAVGRTIWEQPPRAHLADQTEADELVDQVAHTYRTLIHAYIDARPTHPKNTEPAQEKE